MSSIDSGLRVSGIAIAINVLLAIIKITVGVLGNAYALIADGIESSADVVSSLIVWCGLRYSTKPADRDHPYGHGKAEALAGLAVALALLAAGVIIAVQSVREIVTPHHAPAWYTLLVLVVVIVIKAWLSRAVFQIGHSLDSTALKGDAWHHRSDALTSAAAFIGITIALIGGVGWESADDWGALAACGIIAYNGFKLLGTALQEMMDAMVAPEKEQQIRTRAREVAGVLAIEKCRVRKSGLGLHMDIHVVVNGDLSVRRGHEIAHEVSRVLRAADLRVTDVVVHIEPDVR